MGIGRIVRSAAIAAGLAFALAGCAASYRDHGYAPDEASIAELVPGTDTRETVVAKVGRPTASGLMEGSDWYFVQSRWRQFGTGASTEISREVVVVSFDEAGLLTGTARYGLEDGRVVPISRRVTETSIRNVGLIAQLLRNVGNVTANQFFD
jgi:outer membrane protein assembly factor BamE (lipoprotein component of BamABCDE complex)